MPLPEGCPDREPRRDSLTISASANLSHSSFLSRVLAFYELLKSRYRSSLLTILICTASHVEHTPILAPFSRCLRP